MKYKLLLYALGFLAVSVLGFLTYMGIFKKIKFKKKRFPTSLVVYKEIQGNF
jgi:hypothetical protein